jgi:DNA-binding transcriptional regulator YiaG
MKTLKTIPFDVQIPNFDGDGIAETITIEVQAYVDPESGEDILTPESLELIETTQARHMGLMSPEELRDLREERLHLTQEEMSDLLQIGAKTYTRWESGRARPSRSLNVMLCAIRDGLLNVDYLRCLRDGRDWSSLLDRRLANSIVFFQADRVESVSMVVRDDVQAWLISPKSQGELALKAKPTKHSHARHQITVCQSPYPWSEAA